MFSSIYVEFVRPGVLRAALTLAVISSACSGPGDSVPVVTVQGASAPIHVWAAVAVTSPVLYTSQQVNVYLAATNLGSEPIARTLVKEETVLVVNGEEWPGIFRYGLGSDKTPLAPGESQQFNYQLTNRFRKPGVYRLVWKGKGFESLPFEFRIVNDPFKPAPP